MSRAAWREERGLVLVGAIVIIAILFFIGTVMALAIESSLHTVGQIATDDAQAYAAESAVARGVAAAADSTPCPPSGTIRELDSEQQFSVACHPLAKVVTVDKMVQWAVAPTDLPTGTSKDVPLSTLGGPAHVWTVIGWRKLSDGARLGVQLTGGTKCADTATEIPGTAYVCFTSSTPNPSLNISSVGGPVSLSAFIVRAASEGKDSVVTVIGASGSVVDEADVILPAHPKGKDKKGKLEPRLGLWRTVRP